MNDALDPDQIDELLSAHLDGEATAAEVALVEGDPAMGGRLAELQAVRDQIGAMVAPAVEDGDRDAAITAALAAFDDSRATDSEAPSEAVVTSLVEVAARRTGASPRTLRLVAAAAVVILVALAVPLLSRIGDDDADTAAEALENSREESADAMAGGGTGGVASPEADDASGEYDAEAPAAGTAGPLIPTTTAASFAVTHLGSYVDVEELVAAAGSIAGNRAEGDVLAAGFEPAECLTALVSDREADGEIVRLIAPATLAGQPVVVLVTSPRGSDARSAIVVDADDCSPVASRSVP